MGSIRLDQVQPVAVQHEQMDPVPLGLNFSEPEPEPEVRAGSGSCNLLYHDPVCPFVLKFTLVRILSGARRARGDFPARRNVGPTRQHVVPTH